VDVAEFRIFCPDEAMELPSQMGFLVHASMAPDVADVIDL